MNKVPKYEKKKLFKVCHIKISQKCKVSNYTLGILGKLSMHRGAEWFCDISLEEKLSFATILTNFQCKNWLHLQKKIILMFGTMPHKLLNIEHFFH